MIGYYNYTVILTYIGTVFGFMGITYTYSGNTKAALICLMICGLCDMFDGKIASTMKRTDQEKSFGIQIDSLSDLICFGLLPGLIVVNYAGIKPLYIAISAVYMLCALIRLAWFNVDELDRQSHESGCREKYLGLPVTTSAIIIPLIIAAGQMATLPMDKITPWVLLAVATAFLTPFRMKKPKLIGKLIMLVLGIGVFTLVIIGG